LKPNTLCNVGWELESSQHSPTLRRGQRLWDPKPSNVPGDTALGSVRPVAYVDSIGFVVRI